MAATGIPALALLLAVISVAELKTVVSPPEKRESSVCFTRIGCFDNGPPFSTHRLLNYHPQNPDIIQTKFFLFSRANKNPGEMLDARKPESYATQWPTLDVNKPLKFVIHGFVDSIYLNTWQNGTKDELLINGDYNVVVVDWSRGNKPSYPQSVSNTRIVGAQIADLLTVLKEKANLDPGKVHLIGHSLGAHIAGYAGERVPGVGRISGLDAAGPFFANTDKKVRLDETDALFVDTIHTNAASLLKYGFGITQRIGHVDFYPNFGHRQPGCDDSIFDRITRYDLVMSVQEVVDCNHVRAVKLFMESINTKCPFTAHPCASENDFKAGKCHGCSGEGCSQMGFYADKLKPKTPTKYYLSTDSLSPYCQKHLVVSVHLKSGTPDDSGKMKVQVFGSGGSTDWILLNTDVQDIDGGKTYKFYIGTPVELGTIDHVKFSWTHTANSLNPLNWDILGLKHPKIYPDQITVLQEETNTETKFCTPGVSIESTKEATFGNKC